MSANISIVLPLDGINLVLTALAQLPYAQVAGTVDDIKAQAQPQVEKLNAEAAAAKSEAANTAE